MEPHLTDASDAYNATKALPNQDRMTSEPSRTAPTTEVQAHQNLREITPQTVKFAFVYTRQRRCDRLDIFLAPTTSKMFEHIEN
ncbi:MAG: hypothetical protein EON94_02940 [Caulobacteraceae bacterium]|nr:MAG: hypothetical protein EON94_02940 [Caulobacteraceae bacterium]